MKTLYDYDNLREIIMGIVLDKKSFGMDIDDTIINFGHYFTCNLNEYFETNLKEEDIIIYEVSKLLPFKNKGIKNEQIYSAVRKMGNKPEFTKLKTKDGVIDCIEQLLKKDLLKKYSSKKNHMIFEHNNFFMITSRNDTLYDNIKEKTYDTLENNGLIFNKHNFIFDSEKEYVAKALGLTLFFEDNLNTALKIIKKDIPIIMPKQYWNIKTPEDIILLDYKDAKDKHALIEELEGYQGKMFFRIDNFIEFNEYLIDITKKSI